TAIALARRLTRASRACRPWARTGCAACSNKGVGPACLAAVSRSRRASGYRVCRAEGSREWQSARGMPGRPRPPARWNRDPSLWEDAVWRRRRPPRPCRGSHPRPDRVWRDEASMADVTILATGLGFPEGPVVCADGSVVLTEIRNQRCSRVTPDGKVSLFSNCGGGPNGLAIGPDGYFYLCNNGGSRYVEGHSMGLGPHPDYKFGTVERIHPKTGEAKLLYKEANGHPL